MGPGAAADLRGPARLLRRARGEGAALTVHLVGAGPGDPGLITARGLELVRRCDLLVHDRLVHPALVDEAPADALRIARDGLRQEQVSRLLVRHGRAGREVVRLKGGDPFVFGRGAEEATALAAAGVPFEVVPGVSALAAVPAAAGIPLTHRGVSAQVTIASGQGCDGSGPDLAALARAPGTLVLFMALGELEAIAAGLIAHGRDPETPAAAIAGGTLPGQRCAVAPLRRIAAAARELEPPALVVVGETVALRERLRLLLPAADQSVEECFRVGANFDRGRPARDRVRCL